MNGCDASRLLMICPINACLAACCMKIRKMALAFKYICIFSELLEYSGFTRRMGGWAEKKARPLENKAASIFPRKIGRWARPRGAAQRGGHGTGRRARKREAVARRGLIRSGQPPRGRASSRRATPSAPWATNGHPHRHRAHLLLPPLALVLRRLPPAEHLRPCLSSPPPPPSRAVAR